MPIVFRGRPKFGPFYINYGNRGITSWGIRIGPFTHNFTRRQTSIDLPGPASWRSKGRGRKR